MVTGRGTPRLSFSLRRLAIALSVVLTSLTLLASISLKVFTNLNQRHLRAVIQAVDARHAADQSRSLLMAFASAAVVPHDPRSEPERTEGIGRVFGDLDDLRRLVEPSEQPAVDKTRDQVRAYLGAKRDARPAGARGEAAAPADKSTLDAAVASLIDVAHVENLRIQDEVQRSNHWDRIANAIGWGILAVVVLGTLAILLGLYRVALLPTIRLSEAIRSFGEGKTDVRAEVGGATEIAIAARTFNDLMDLVTGQHARMLDFLASTAKQLKQPVGVMRTVLAPSPPERRGERAGDGAQDGEAGRRRTALVRREVERLDRLVDAFLDATRIEWQRLDLQQPRQDLRGLVRDVVQLYESFSTVHQVSLSVPEQPVWVCFDEKRMTQVLDMLLSNAVQFSPRGGLVSVALTEDGATEEAVLAVTDYGVAIQQEAMRRIFEPFHSIREVNLPGQPRLGSVALSLSKRIVEAHGGRIEVESAPRVGTTFRLHLPLARTREEERRVTRERAASTAKSPAR
jgi:signal transduction histidine kinase